MLEVNDRPHDDEAADRALFARRARAFDGAPPDFARVLAELERRASDPSPKSFERRGRRVAAASMTIACVAATVAAWIHVGDASHTIVAEPDAGVAAPEAIAAASFEEPGSCASDEPAVCLAPPAPPPPPARVAAASPVCSSSTASCDDDVTCSLAGP
jgi:hypothetical protein